MGRGKLALELIPKEKSRKTTYEKRKKGLMKKAEEFSILCGVDTCMIIYGERAAEPEVWPPNHEEVRRIIDRYRSEGLDRRAKRTTGLPDFFVNRKKKLDGELKKVRAANWEAKYPVSDEMIEGLSEDQLRSLLISLKEKLDVAKERLAAMKAAKFDEIVEGEMALYDFYAKDNVMYHQDHLLPVPNNFLDAKPVFEFSHGPPLGHEPLLQPPPGQSAVYNAFPGELVPFGVHYPMVRNDAAPMLGGINDYHYPPMPQNFQFPQLGSSGGMLFPEPTYDLLSNMAVGNVGHCEGMMPPTPMQMAMPMGHHHQMVPRVRYPMVQAEHSAVVQSSPTRQMHNLTDLFINSKGKGIA